MPFTSLVGCIGVKRHFNISGHIMAVGNAHVFPGFLSTLLTQLFFLKPATSFFTYGKKVRLNQGSNFQPPGHESDTLTTEPPWRGIPIGEEGVLCLYNIN